MGLQGQQSRLEGQHCRGGLAFIKQGTDLWAPGGAPTIGYSEPFRLPFPLRVAFDEEVGTGLSHTTSTCSCRSRDELVVSTSQRLSLASEVNVTGVLDKVWTVPHLTSARRQLGMPVSSNTPYCAEKWGYFVAGYATDSHNET